MTHFALLLAAASRVSAADTPYMSTTEKARDFDLTPDPIDLWRNDPYAVDAFRSVEHEHEGRLLHQYARQPRAKAHRICRGRP